MMHVSIWERFLDSLDTPGGHILILILLLVLGWKMGSMELTVASMGALFAVLRSTQSSGQRRQDPGGPTP